MTRAYNKKDGPLTGLIRGRFSFSGLAYPRGQNYARPGKPGAEEESPMTGREKNRKGQRRTQKSHFTPAETLYSLV